MIRIVKLIVKRSFSSLRKGKPAQIGETGLVVDLLGGDPREARPGCGSLIASPLVPVGIDSVGQHVCEFVA